MIGSYMKLFTREALEGGATETEMYATLLITFFSLTIKCERWSDVYVKRVLRRTEHVDHLLHNTVHEEGVLHGRSRVKGLLLLLFNIF